jgi:Right handed beta helix region
MGIRMRLPRNLWLVLPTCLGLCLVLTLLWLTSSQANRVVALIEQSPGGVVRYVSRQGNDIGNDCSTTNQPCKSIPYAIQVAEVGDYIHVAGGIYSDTTFDAELTFGVTATVLITKQISSLLGGYSPDFSTRDIETFETILTAANSPGAYVAVLANTDVRFGGFTLTGGSGAYSPEGTYYPGAAIRVFGGSPTIHDNKIINNHGYRRGGGIYIGWGATPSILGNIIDSNSVTNLRGEVSSNGGGIYVASGPTLINGNLILSNSAGREGGGIYVGWNVPVTITENIIANNRVLDPDFGRGGGVRTSGDSQVVVISNNEIHGNSLSGGFEGSGLYIASPAIIDGNMIQDNRAPNGHFAVCVMNVTVPVTMSNNLVTDNIGSGIRAINNQDFYLVNNTVARNTYQGVQVMFPPTTSPAETFLHLLNNIVAYNGECGVYIENMGQHRMEYNNVYGQKYAYCGFPSIQAYNISQDPSFTQMADEDYHLQPGSPAIDQADNSVAPLYDLEGTLRRYQKNVDMGAYEFVYPRVFVPMVINSEP